MDAIQGEMDCICEEFRLVYSDLDELDEELRRDLGGNDDSEPADINPDIARLNNKVRYIDDVTECTQRSMDTFAARGLAG